MTLTRCVKSADSREKDFAALCALAYARTLRSAQSIFSYDAVPGKMIQIYFADEAVKFGALLP